MMIYVKAWLQTVGVKMLIFAVASVALVGAVIATAYLYDHMGEGVKDLVGYTLSVLFTMSFITWMFWGEFKDRVKKLRKEES